MGQPNEGAVIPMDNHIMTKEQLAESTGRHVSEVSDDEYGKYLDWMNSDW